MANCCSGPVCASSAVNTPSGGRCGRARHQRGVFVVELVAGLASGSVAPVGGRAGFAGDAANYAISLVALSMGLMWRARVAMGA